MSRVLVFAPWNEKDEPLWNSRWIARQTAALLASHHMVEDHHAVRHALEHALAEGEFAGLLFCGHGSACGVRGADDVDALDANNTSTISVLWAHLFACNAGRELVPACTEHPALFVGYSTPVIVEFTVDDLEAELQRLLVRLVTATTLALVAGSCTKAALQRIAAEAAEELTAWLLDHSEEGEHLGLHCLAETLVERMVTNR